MGCLGYILLVLSTAWAINNGWIVRTNDMHLGWAVFLVVIFVGFVDFLLGGIRTYIKATFFSLAFLTGGLFWEVINWVSKYFSLWVVCALTGWFQVPWIAGPEWLKALVIGFVLTVLTRASSDNSSNSSRSRR